MRFNKFAGTIAAATLSLAAMTGVAHAQNTTVAAFGGSTPGATDFIYTNGSNTLVSAPGGSVVMVTSSAAGPVSIPAFLTFGPTTLVSFTQAGPTVNAIFGPAAFSLGTTAGGNDLLQGSFTQLFLNGGPGSATLQTFGNNVTYTSGSLYTTWLSVNPGKVPPVIGNLSIGLTSLTPATAISVSGGAIQSFNAQSIGGTFDATATTPTAVPEPSEWIAMGMAATSVGGLMFRAKLKLRTRRQQIAA